MDCIFCQIASGDMSAHILYEDEYHLGFLSNRPNTPGFSVLITKEHWPSDLQEMPDEVFNRLCLATRDFARMLTNALEGVGRTGIIFEGFGVNHAHAKLAPMHGTVQKVWAPIRSTKTITYKTYEGFLSTNGGPLLDSEELQRIADMIRTNSSSS